MGQYDSSRTRVAPFFDALSAADPTGAAWLAPLLALPRFGSATKPMISPPLRESAWYPREAEFAPPRTLLHWLVDHIAALARGPNPPAGAVNHESRGPHDQRALLLAGDAGSITQAHALISAGPAARAWYVLEGPSQPDALLVTDDAMIVVEGKRTEGGPTTYTQWLPGRHQMLRHLDAAWEIRENRRLYGFFVVQGEDAAPAQVPVTWQRAAADTLRPEALATSLPHRTDAERDEIARAFLGAVTWQAACAALGVSYAGLPNSVPASPAVGGATA